MLTLIRTHWIVWICGGMLTMSGCDGKADVESTGASTPPPYIERQYQLDALRGGAKSTNSLGELIRLYSAPFYIENELFKWIEIGSENGDLLSRSWIAGQLLESVNLFRHNRMRAWYWYAKLATSGDVSAKQALERFSEAEISGYRVERDKPYPIPQTVTLNDLKPLQDRAWLGSAEAALKLYDFHTEYRSQFEERLYWARIAAQNGSDKAPVMLAKLLLPLGIEDGRVRAWFWLNRAAKAGNPEAAELLRKEFPKAP